MLGFVIGGLVAVLAMLLSYLVARAAFLALDPLIWRLASLTFGGLGNRCKLAAGTRHDRLVHGTVLPLVHGDHDSHHNVVFDTVDQPDSLLS